MTTEEGGAQAKEYIAKYAADRVRNVSVVLARLDDGLLRSATTTSSTRSRSEDFYAMAAFFADIKEIPVGRQEQTPLPLSEQEAQLKEFEAKIAATQAEIDKPLQNWKRLKPSGSNRSSRPAT